MAKGIRIDRINSEMQKAISEIINFELENPEIRDEIISIVDVETSSDVSVSKVFIGILGNGEKINKVFTQLEKSKNYIKKRLAEKMLFKSVPELVFLKDDSVERGNRVLNILKDLKKD